MDSAVGQFVERLFQPIALGLLSLFLLPKAIWKLVAQQTAALPIAKDVAEQLGWIAPLLILFVFGQFFAVLGQVIFHWLLRLLDDDFKQRSFFSRVYDLDESELVVRRYDAIRFQVDLLCGIAGVGLVAALLAFVWLPEFRPSLPWWVYALLALSSYLAAFFHARQFMGYLREVRRG